MRLGPGSVSAAAPVSPSRWPWLGHRVLTAWFAVTLALCLGLLSLAAVAEMRVECRDGPVYRSTNDGLRATNDDRSRTVGPPRRQCGLAWRSWLPA
jgi:hypothetical protein